MKSTALTILIALVFFSMADSASANRNYQLGLDFVSPTGDFSDVAGGGGGLALSVISPLNDNINLTVGVAAIGYGGIEIEGFIYDTEIQWFGYPITAGVSYHLSGVEQPGLFIRGKTGVLFKLGTITFGGG